MSIEAVAVKCAAFELSQSPAESGRAESFGRHGHRRVRGPGDGGLEAEHLRGILIVRHGAEGRGVVVAREEEPQAAGDRAAIHGGHAAIAADAFPIESECWDGFTFRAIGRCPGHACKGEQQQDLLHD